MRNQTGYKGGSYTHSKHSYENKPYQKHENLDMLVESRQLPPFEVDSLKELTIVNTRCLYVDGTPEYLTEFEKMFDKRNLLTPFGKFEEIRVHKYADSNTGSNQPKVAKMLYVRFKYEFQASLVYRSINNFFKDYLHKLQKNAPPPHLRSYFKKSRFCTNSLYNKSCSNESCAYLHKIPDKARYFPMRADRNFNHVYDSAMAFLIIKENKSKIQKLKSLFDSTQYLAGRFSSPIEILRRLKLMDETPTYERQTNDYYTGYSDNQIDSESESQEVEQIKKHTRTERRIDRTIDQTDPDSEDEYIPVARTETAHGRVRVPVAGYRTESEHEADADYLSRDSKDTDNILQNSEVEIKLIERENLDLKRFKSEQLSQSVSEKYDEYRNSLPVLNKHTSIPASGVNASRN